MESLKDAITESRTDKSQEQMLWDIGLKFLEGDQYLTYDQTHRQYAGDKRQNANKLVVNLLQAKYRHVTARLAINYPSVVVLPASPSSEDLTKARASETALRYFWRSASMKRVISDAVQWVVSCGTAALHTYFDPGTEDVVTRVVSPYDLFAEPKVSSWEESQWIAIRTWHTKRDLLAAYPDAKKVIESAGDGDGGQKGGGLASKKVPANRLAVYEVYYRDGRHMFVLESGGVLFEEDEFPGLWPVQIISYNPVPGRLWAMSLLTPLVPLQYSLNELQSRILETIRLSSNPKLLAPNGSMQRTSISSKPGEIVFYDPKNGIPQWQTPAGMPEYVIHMSSQLQAFLNDVGGIHASTMGKRVTGISSGKAIEELSQQDMAQLQVTQSSIEQAVEDLAKVVLVLMREFYNEAKNLRMMDQTGRVIWHELRQTDLVDDPEVFLEAGSLFRDEALDRDAQVMELLQAQLISPEEALTQLSFRAGGSHITKKMQSMSHARDLLEACKRGFAVEIYKTDDIPVIMEVFGEAMREQAYYQLPQRIQDYIADVYGTLVNMTLPPEQQQAAQMQNKVFPASPPPSADTQTAVGTIVSQQSPQAKQQVMGAMLGLARDVGQVQEAERLLATQVDGAANEGGMS